MKKKKFFSVTSFVLSVVMLMFSLPTAASPMGEGTAEEMTAGVALEETALQTEEMVIDRLSGLEESETNPNARGNSMGYYDYENVTTIPNGVYALQNFGNAGLWMDIEGDSTTPGMHVQQYAYTTSPADGSSPAGLYRITQYGDTGRYIIRAMLSSTLSFGIVGNEVLTKTIPANDADVTDADTFYIEFCYDGYAIKPYGSTQYIGANDTDASGWAGSPDSYLIPQNLTTNMDQNLWILQSKNIDIEAGVYAFQNKAHPYRWMDTEGDFYTAGEHIQQYNYQLSPAMTFSRGGLFKIAPYGTTGCYVIRLMANNYLSFYRNGNEFLTHEINRFDERVDSADTFSIQFYNGGYVIRPAGSPYCIASNHATASGYEGAPDSYLVPEIFETAGNRACWTLEKYTDEDQWEVIVERPETLKAGNQATFTSISAFSTKQDVASTRLSIEDGAEALVTWTWNMSARQLTATLHDEGTFRLRAEFESFSVANVHLEYKDYTIVLPVAEGTYFFRNAQLGSYMQVYDDDAANGYTTSGAMLELHPFDGEHYQKFTLEHVGDGYYKIITTCGKVLSIREDYVNGQRYIWQAFYGGWDYQHWKFLKMTDGTYVIRLQSAEPYTASAYWCMGVHTSSEGDPYVEQQEYTDNSIYLDKWLIYQLGTEAMLLAIHEDDRDRINLYGNVMYSLSKMGIDNFNLIYTNNLNSNSCLLQMAASRVFISRSHGGGNANHSWIKLFSMGAASRLYSDNIFDFSTNTALVNFHNVDLLLYVGCKTAFGGNGSSTNNLIVASVHAGADFAVGFEDTIDCNGANTWTEYFCEYYSEGQSVWDAAANAAADTAEDHYNLEKLNQLGTDTFCVAQ